MASDDPAHARTRSDNIIPLQDLSQEGVASQEHESGLGRTGSHRRTISDRLAGLRTGRRGSNTNSRYEPLSERSPSPRARETPNSPVAFVTSPTGQRERIPDEDDEAGYSPVEDRGAFQAAIGFAGLSFNAGGDDSSEEDDHIEETPPRPSQTARRSRHSLPSLRTNSADLSDMVSVQLDDG